MKKRTVAIVAAFFTSIILSLFSGAGHLVLSDLLSDSESFSRVIFINLRLPRTLLCIIAGMMLGGSGTAFQYVFRNPLAEPGILGITAGATLGAVSAFCFKSVPLTLGAFFGAVSAGGIIIAASNLFKKTETSVTVLLCGTVLGTLYSALTSIILSVHSDKLQSMYMWMLGSFNGRGWKEVWFALVPAIPALVLLFLCTGKLDLLAGGEKSAMSLGLDVKKLIVLVLFASSLASSAAVVAGGTIGFVGLIAPHVSRMLWKCRAKKLMVLSMVWGSVLLCISDSAARVIIRPSEIPVGTILALLGVPFFIWLLSSSK